MAGHKKKKHEDHPEHIDERWLITYADLMTLLVALFMVLFSISSVNKSKFEAIQSSLQDAFSGRILPGGKGIKEAGGTDNIASPSVHAPQTNLQPYLGGKESDAKNGGGAAAAKKEQAAFEQIKTKIDKLAAEQGLSSKVQTKVIDDGLLIRVLTDDLLFSSGSAVPREQARPLLDDLARLLGSQPDHKLIVEGHTDDMPIRSARFPDNLSLSTARAESIYRTFQQDGIDPARMTAAGSSSYRSIAPNTSAAGRSLNRRVEILVPRTLGVSAETETTKVTVPSIAPDLKSEAAKSTSQTTSESTGSAESSASSPHESSSHK